MRQTNYDKLDDEQRDILDQAFEALSNAYNPYSKFSVGAAVLTSCGEVITGVNVENASYGLTVCAERVAIFRAVAEGYRGFDKLAVIGKGENHDVEDVTGPCGACRQVIYEFSQLSESPIEVIMSNTKMDKVDVATIDELVPIAFGPRDVGVNLVPYRNS